MAQRKVYAVIRRIAAQGGILAFFIMAFEVLIMISPFAFFFYSVFNPLFHWLNNYPATQWLTHFFLPHMILPATWPLKMVRIIGSVLFILGSLTFIICALQVYLGKIFKWGIANSGLYKYIRHPQYTALGIWGLGMAILWPRFIVLVTLSVMFILYYFLAKDEERRMLEQFGEDYASYMHKTGMFFPRTGLLIKFKSHLPIKSSRYKALFALLSVLAVTIASGFLLRDITLNSLPLKTRGNVTVVSIMPEDLSRAEAIFSAIQTGRVTFLSGDRYYLAYEMPVDYIMQGMIANTGAEHHLYKQHHTISLITDWVLHPFEHLRRSPAAQMAKLRQVDPALARRHHCPLGIREQGMNCADCAYRRVIFVEVKNPHGKVEMGKGLFAFTNTREPAGFIDVNTKTGEIVHQSQVPSGTAWRNVPTPEI